MEIIILSIVSILTIILLLIYIIVNKKMKLVKINSHLIRKLTTINQKYKFNTMDTKTIKFKPELKSKRSLDNLNLSQYVLSEINENFYYYESIFRKLDENNSAYLKYISEYNSIKIYTTQNKFERLKLKNIKYKSFLKYEKIVFNKMKLKEPQISINATCHATYTSPAGRNHYWKDASFTYQDLKRFEKIINDAEIKKIKDIEAKEKALKQKREKEKKLRELDKIEKELAIKKASLEKEKQEFEDATKGHIYSKENLIKSKKVDNIKIHDSDEPYIKLKKLKQLLDNGEISFEEYSNKKKEIL